MISQDMNLFLIFLSAMIVNNILLIRFIALCSFFGISNNMQTSIGMGIAVVFVMVMATTISWLVYHFILVPFDLVYLRTASFILTIATFVQLEEMFIRKMFPPLYRAMGIYLPADRGQLRGAGRRVPGHRLQPGPRQEPRSTPSGWASATSSPS